jgi:osmotically-inducible protein OsmY
MSHRVAALLAALAAGALLQGCLEMAVVGAGAGVVSAVDRRTTGTQIEDEGIELRVANRIGERFGGTAHVNAIAFNRSVLLTGEVPDAGAKGEVERIARGVPNVRAVTNEVQVAGVSAYSSRASDSTITGKVKARFLDSNKFNPIHVKVVTEAGVVYLLGLVTDKEAADATEIARTTSGVRKVVKVLEYCKSTDEACRPR